MKRFTTIFVVILVLVFTLGLAITAIASTNGTPIGTDVQINLIPGTTSMVAVFEETDEALIVATHDLYFGNATILDVSIDENTIAATLYDDSGRSWNMVTSASAAEKVKGAQASTVYLLYDTDTNIGHLRAAIAPYATTTGAIDEATLIAYLTGDNLPARLATITGDQSALAHEIVAGLSAGNLNPIDKKQYLSDTTGVNS